MSRSSIFSFDTLHAAGFRPYGAGLAVLLLLLVEFGLVRNDYVWSFAEDSQTGIVDALERKVLAVREPPRVVVLGSSRIRDAVVPAVVAGELDLPLDSVVNLGLTAGRPFDSLIMYRRNRELLSQADVLVLGVDEFTDRKVENPSERYRRFASVDDRRRDFQGETGMALMVGSVWRTYDANKSLGRWLKSFVQRRSRAVAIAEDGRVQWRKEGVGVVDDSLDRAESLYQNRESPEYDLYCLTELLDLAQADQLPVVLFRPPINPKFVALRDEFAPWAEAEFESYSHKLAQHPAVRATLYSGTGIDVNVPFEDFWDYGHLQPEGAEKVSRDLAKLLSTTMHDE